GATGATGPTGAGGSYTTALNSLESPADLPPGSPGSIDDECNGSPSGSWTALDAGDADTFTAGESTYCDYSHDGSGTDRIRGELRTAPSTPYTITARLSVICPGAFVNGGWGGGLIARNSTSGRAFTLGLSSSISAADMKTKVQKWNSTTSYNSDAVSAALGIPMYFRMVI